MLFGITHLTLDLDLDIIDNIYMYYSLESGLESRILTESDCQH